MNTESRRQGESEITLGPAMSNSSGPKRIDRYFPPLPLMVGLAVVAMVIFIFSGWKIVNLEEERARLTLQRQLLERDLKSHGELLQALPSLENQRQALDRKIGDLEGKVRTAETRLQTISANMALAAADLEKAKEERLQAQSAAAVARQEYADLSNQILSARTKSQNLEQQVESLHIQEKTLEKSSQDLKIQLANLRAEISGLEQERRNKKAVLESMTNDQSDLHSISDQIGIIAKELDQSRQSAERVLQELAVKNKSFEQNVRTIEKNAGAMENQIRDLEKRTERVESVATSVENAGKIVHQTSGNLSRAETDLKSAMESLRTAAKGAAEASREVSSAVEIPVKHLESEISKLSASVTLLEGHSGAVEKQSSFLAQYATELGKTSETAKTVISELTANVSETKIAVEGVKRTDMALLSAANDVEKAAKVLKKPSEQMSEALAGDLKALSEKAVSLESWVGKLAQAVRELEETAKSVSTLQSNLSGDRDALRMIIDNTGERLNGLTQTLSKLERSLSEIAERVDKEGKGEASIEKSVQKVSEGQQKQ